MGPAGSGGAGESAVSAGRRALRGGGRLRRRRAQLRRIARRGDGGRSGSDSRRRLATRGDQNCPKEGERTMKTKLIGAVALLLACGFAGGQESASKTKTAPKMGGGGSGTSSKKSELELALEEALKNTPDLRVAVAKAAEAEAQLVRARAQVVQKVVAAWQAVDAAKANKAMCDRRLEQLTATRAKVKAS